MGVGRKRHVPTALPLGKMQYPLYSRLGEPQGWSGRVQKISPPLGFDPRTVQPVAIRYPGPLWTTLIYTSAIVMILKSIVFQ